MRYLLLAVLCAAVWMAPAARANDMVDVVDELPAELRKLNLDEVDIDKVRRSIDNVLRYARSQGLDFKAQLREIKRSMDMAVNLQASLPDNVMIKIVEVCKDQVLRSNQSPNKVVSADTIMRCVGPMVNQQKSLYR